MLVPGLPVPLLRSPPATEMDIAFRTMMVCGVRWSEQRDASIRQLSSVLRLREPSSGPAHCAVASRRGADLLPIRTRRSHVDSVVHCRTFVSGCARPSSLLIICDLLEGLPLAPAPDIAPEAALLPALLPKEEVVAPNSPVDRGLCALNAMPVASAEVLTLLLVYPGCR